MKFGSRSFNTALFCLKDENIQLFCRIYCLHSQKADESSDFHMQPSSLCIHLSCRLTLSFPAIHPSGSCIFLGEWWHHCAALEEHRLSSKLYFNLFVHATSLSFFLGCLIYEVKNISRKWKGEETKQSLRRNVLMLLSSAGLFEAGSSQVRIRRISPWKISESEDKVRQEWEKKQEASGNCGRFRGKTAESWIFFDSWVDVGLMW